MGSLELLRWRCRRGMRELDLLLLGFVDDFGYTLNSEELRAFQRLLEFPDNLLSELLMHRVATSDKGVEVIIDKIRAAAAHST